MSSHSTGLGPNSKVMSTVLHPHPQGKITPPVTIVLSHIKVRWAGSYNFIPFNPQDILSNSRYCLPYNSYEASLENLLLDQLVIPLIVFFLFLIAFLLGIVFIL